MPLTSVSSKAFYYDIDLQGNTLFNAKIHPVTTVERTTLAGSLNSDDKALIVYDTTELALYSWNGNTWQKIGISQTDIDKINLVYNQTITGMSVSRTDTTQTITLSRRDGSILFTSFNHAHVFTQGTPATTWSIFHNLGKYPSVSVVDSSNNEVVGDVNYNSANQVTITFSAAFSGKAYLN